MKILVADPISSEGLDIIRPCAQVEVKTGLKPAELMSIIGDYDGLVVRSQTQVTADIIRCGKKLQVIARAGVGIDNIDVEEATRCGIVVVNAPTGNTISAAEHTIALMLALARHIPQANAALKAGQWKRNEFMGTEVRGKTLGLIGLGNVGSEVARRARSMGMKLIAYDPFVSVEYARNLSVELVTIEHVFKEADFITLHTPLTSATRGLIGAKELAMMKPTVRIINAARGGLIDEEALAGAVKENRIGGAAIDVFPVEPCTRSVLFENDKIIVTPHLGASTKEAQATAAVDVAEQVVDIINGRAARYAVNAPFIPPELVKVLSPFMATARVVGRLVSQLAEGQLSTLNITYEGEISNYDTSPLKAAVLGGLLENISEERVNLINANVIASRRGISVVERKESVCQNYASLITVETGTTSASIVAAGTVLRNETHLVRVNDYWMDFVPTGGYFLFCDHKDRPGLLGAVGKVTGDADINISAMNVARLKPRGQALMILALDEPLTEASKQKILAIPDVYSVKLVKI
jgi:D-3-phosphoglycerate dehydrogenase